MLPTDKNDTIVVAALRARTNFGKLLRRVEDERRSLVIEKRGTPKAVLLSIRDYVRLAAMNRPDHQPLHDAAVVGRGPVIEVRVDLGHSLPDMFSPRRGWMRSARALPRRLTWWMSDVARPVS